MGLNIFVDQQLIIILSACPLIDAKKHVHVVYSEKKGYKIKKCVSDPATDVDRRSAGANCIV